MEKRRNTILRSGLPVKQNGEPVTRDHNHPVTHRHIAGNRIQTDEFKSGYGNRRFLNVPAALRQHHCKLVTQQE